MEISLAEDLAPAGLRDLANGVESFEALLVLIGAPRLRDLGFDVPDTRDPEMRLYEKLAGVDSDTAHSRYNALVRRLVDYERSVGRARVTADMLREFMRSVRCSTPIYLCGGASAVLLGWRATTRNIDLMTDDDHALRAIAEVKARFNIVVKLASPAHFVPELLEWQERSIAIDGVFLHFDFYTQCLAKLERDHDIDRHDVSAMVRDGFVDPKRLVALFNAASLLRYPAIHAPALRARVEAFALQ